MTSIDELRSRILTAEGLIAAGHSTQSLARAVTIVDSPVVRGPVVLERID